MPTSPFPKKIMPEYLVVFLIIFAFIIQSFLIENYFPKGAIAVPMITMTALSLHVLMFFGWIMYWSKAVEK